MPLMFWELALALHICILVGLPVEVVEYERAELPVEVVECERAEN